MKDGREHAWRLADAIYEQVFELGSDQDVPGWAAQDTSGGNTAGCMTSLACRRFWMTEVLIPGGVGSKGGESRRAVLRSLAREQRRSQNCASSCS